MKRRPTSSADPELERVFDEAYRDTMVEAERLERAKELTDHVEAYVELFERELSGRDLSAEERHALTDRFERRLREADEEAERRLEERRSKRRRTAGGAAGMAVAAFCLFVLIYHPFKPLDEVRNDLDTYVERVEAGSGAFADDFYRILDRYDRRLADPVVETYRLRMHEILDERFDELLARLRAGDLTLLDDARKWAKLFPEKAERKTRKELVDNAGVKGVGGAVRNILDGLKEAGEDAAEWVQEQIEEGNRPTE